MNHIYTLISQNLKHKELWAIIFIVFVIHILVYVYVPLLIQFYGHYVAIFY